MTSTLVHSQIYTGRHMRSLRREPAYLLFTLAQPMVWLLLFSQLFERVVDVPGFGDINYITYLTPGVVIMTAVMTANWAGTSFIEDMNRGVMDRNLSSPVRRSSLIIGILNYQAVITIVQTLIVLAVGWLLGAEYPGGVIGIGTVVALAVLLGTFFSALSCFMALQLRSQEALIGMSQMLALPLVFMSTVLVAPDLLPNWMSTVATFNPVNWAAVACREALEASPEWGSVSGNAALLLLVSLLTGGLATWAFRSYQRNV